MSIGSRKGGHNSVISQITERPAPPASMTPKLTIDERRRCARVNLGFQCPECSSILVNDRLVSKHHSVTGAWECASCGCQWDRNYYPQPVDPGAAR